MVKKTEYQKIILAINWAIRDGRVLEEDYTIILKKLESDV